MDVRDTDSESSDLAPPRSVTSCRILLVEDNAGDVELIRELLDEASEEDSSLRYDMRWAPRIAEAQRELEAHVFDAVLLDLSLPDATGVDGLETLHALAPRIPIIVLTGDVRDRIARRCLTHGAQDYLHKGAIDGHALRRTIGFAVLRQREELARLERAHDDRLRSVGMLAAGVAHELNTPAMYVSANLESVASMLDQLPADETIAEAKRAIGDALEGVERMADIVARLREFSRVESPESTRVDIAEIVNQAIALTQSQVPASSLDVDCAPDLPLIVGYRSRLIQVLVNLLVNAGHAVGRAAAPQIEIRARSADGAIVTTVGDNGCGMTRRQVRQIFDPFYTTKPVGEGTGLGLALSREIARQHAGSLEVQSAPGKGSTFTLTLPLESDLAAVGPTVAPPSQRAPSRRRRLLVIDDEAALVRGLTRLLRSHHDVVGAIGGREAIRILAEDERFDAVLCDLLMPEVDGRAVLDHVRAHHPQLASRFAFLTGGSKLSFDVRDDPAPPLVAEKPISRDRLLELLDSLT